MRITRGARVHVAGTLPETTGRGVGKQLYRVPPSIRLNEAASMRQKAAGTSYTLTIRNQPKGDVKMSMTWMKRS